jgi:hypothetical protein
MAEPKVRKLEYARGSTIEKRSLPRPIIAGVIVGTILLAVLLSFHFLFGHIVVAPMWVFPIPFVLDRMGWLLMARATAIHQLPFYGVVIGWLFTKPRRFRWLGIALLAAGHFLLAWALTK